MIALGTVLANIKIYSLPNGGSITLFSMLPFIMISFRHGVKWGLFTGFVNSLLQMLLGFYAPPAPGLLPLVGMILLDYVLAFTLLGLRRGILSEVETPAEPRTATEITATSVDYDLTIRDLQSAWTDTVQQAMALCSALGAVYGLDGLPQTAAPAIDWGDGVLYDRARIWAEQRELVDAGLLRPELALAWYFDLPHETEAELAEIRRRFMGDAGRAQ